MRTAAVVRVSTRVRPFAIALCLAMLLTPVLAGLSGQVLLSTEDNQFLTGVGTVRHNNVYEVDDTGTGIGLFVPSFVPPALGLDAVAIDPDGGLLFSVTATGGVNHSGGYIVLREDRVYRYDTSSAEIAAFPDWGNAGIQIGSLDALEMLADGALGFSTAQVRGVTHGGGYTVLRPSNVYRFDAASGVISLLLDGEGLGLPNVDAVAVLLDGRLVFSTSSNKFLAAQGIYLRQKNAYVYEPADGSISLWLDADQLGLFSLDAIESAIIDDDPPLIAAAVTPPPNAIGWHNGPVTISFTCSDATSGIEQCPDPVTLTGEGANQVVTGTAIDAAGNAATVSVMLNIDLTPPTVTFGLPMIDGQIFNTPSPMLAVTYLDSLSGVNLETFSASLDGEDLTDCFLRFAAQASCDLRGRIELADGNHTIEVSITDNVGFLPDPASSRAFEISVGGDETSLAGQILDSYTEQPVVGATIFLKGFEGEAVQTDSQGFFSLSDIATGSQIMLVVGGTAVPDSEGRHYADYSRPFDIIDGQRVQIARPIFIPPIDLTGAVEITPDMVNENGQLLGDCIVDNPNIGVKLTLTTGTTVTFADGRHFGGTVSVSEVPKERAPAQLPPTVDPALLITIQPAGLSLDQPSLLEFPNRDQWPVGNEADLLSFNHDLGIFENLSRNPMFGPMQVRASGVSGNGPMTGGWHCACPPENNQQNNDCPTCKDMCPANPDVNPFSGAYRETIELPTYTTLNSRRGVILEYNSDTAFPQPIVATTSSIPVRAAVPSTVSLDVLINGSNVGTPVLFDTAELSESEEQPFQSALVFDATALPTGVYNYTVVATSNYALSRARNISGGRVSIINRKDSPYGAGWSVAGIPELCALPSGAVEVLDESNRIRRYTLAPMAEEVLASGVPGPHGMAVSPGGAYGNYIYVLSGRRDIYRVAPGGTVVFFGQTRPDVRAHAVNLFFDETPDQRFGGYLYAVLDNGGGPGTASGGVDRILPDGSYQVFVNVFGSPGMFGAWDGFIDETGRFGYDMFISDFETDNGGSPSNIIRLTPSGQRSAFDAVLLRGLMPLELDRAGTFGGDMLAGNPRVISSDPWWNGADDAVYRVAPNGTRSIVVPNAGRGNPGDVLVDSSGQFNGNLFVLYAGTPALLVEFDSNGLEVSERLIPAASRGLAQDRSGAFGNALLYSASTAGEIRKVLPEGSQFMSEPGDTATLRRLADGRFQRRLKDGTVQVFRPDGRLESVADRNGNATSYAYDAQGRLMSITDPVGLVTALAYAGSYLASVTDPANRTTSFSHGASGDLLSVTFPDGSTRSFDYDSQHYLTALVDQRGNQTDLELGPGGVFTGIVYPDGAHAAISPAKPQSLLFQPLGQIECEPFSFPGSGGPVIGECTIFPSVVAQQIVATLTESPGYSTPRKISFGPRGPVELADELDRKLLLSYDDLGRVIALTEVNGSLTEYSYDASGNLTGVVQRGTNGASADDRTYQLHYEPGFNLLTQVDTPGGGTARIARDPADGAPTSVVDPSNRRLVLSHNDRGQLIEITDEQQPVPGRSIINYDSVTGNIVEMIDPLNNSTVFAYDDAGNVAAVTDAEGRTTVYTYDSFNRLLTVSGPMVQTAEYTYDSAGNLFQVVTPSGGRRAYAYDSRQRLIAVTDPLGNAETLGYDLRGRVTRHTTRIGRNRDFIYDAIGRLIEQRVDGEVIASFSYDHNQNGMASDDPRFVARATTDVGSWILDYDAFGNLVAERVLRNDGGPAATVEWKLDKMGQVVEVSLDDVVIHFGYDAAGRINAVHPDGDTEVLLDYDEVGRLVTITRSGGVNTSYAYDVAGRLRRLLHENGVQTILSVALLGDDAYDAVGNPLLLQETSLAFGDRTIALAYDDLGRIVSVNDSLQSEAHAFGYDAFGNRAGGTYDEADRLLANVDFSYSYDEDGNLVSRTPGGLLETSPTTFDYDAGGRLVESAGNGAVTRYVYDPFGRRIEKIVDGQTTRYVYDRRNVLAEFRPDGSRLVYAHAALDFPVSVASASGVKYPLLDIQGSVREIVDESGAALQSYAFDVLGRMTSVADAVGTPVDPANAALIQSLGFSAQPFDAESGLWFYRARYYDPSLGRFISEDVIAGALSLPQTLNAYTFVANNPLRNRDPLGLQSFQIGLDPLVVNPEPDVPDLDEGTEPTPTFPPAPGTKPPEPFGAEPNDDGDAVRDVPELPKEGIKPGKFPTGGYGPVVTLPLGDSGVVQFGTGFDPGFGDGFSVFLGCTFSW